MKTLGIIGGISPKSTTSYYTQINHAINQAKGDNHSAKLIVYSVDFEQIVQCQKNGDWQQAGEILADAGKRLETIGAEAILLATNTMHKVAEPIIQAINIPFLHIIDATVQAIKEQKLNNIALLGTRFTMQDNFYRDYLNKQQINVIVPNDEQQAEIHRIIFDELCVGIIRPESKQFYLDIIKDLQQRGAEGVILGCTEIGLLIQQADYNLPLFDSTGLHSKMAIKFILE
ncbi:aspartate/glutamate racemase [Vespertiliibacter pulmonis]|uniref:Aspartate racemase n=1 Tax=Vespertiliibacter pulmonis TaxID=1443036 RepID=A0A3N4VKC4_9PAST|nr:aspartate/glutamate racemase family protein [Vespertiliibacter pulmonis]QLB20902.1 aspartate/glutamate racemase [Vespertiliibacter pulmonis]RPE83556.1 aspartate racemase [Vespertiliibacter pulmonis]